MNEQIIYGGFERVWKMFEKTDHEIQELRQFLREQSQETDRQFKESNEQFRQFSQETDRQFKESNEQFRQLSQETKHQFKESNEQFRQLSLETDRRFKESNEQFRQLSRETDKKINKVSQDIGKLGGRWGEFVESMVRPAVLRLFQERGLIVHEVHRNLVAERNGLSAEIDLLVTNDEHCVAVEVKSLLSVDDVRDHLARLEKFKALFPRYADVQLMGAVASAVIYDDVSKYAYRQGLFVLGQKGHNMEILNDSAFKPKIY